MYNKLIISFKSVRQFDRLNMWPYPDKSTVCDEFLKPVDIQIRQISISILHNKFKLKILTWCEQSIAISIRENDIYDQLHFWFMTSSFNILSVDQAEYVRNNSICRIAERIHSDYEYQGTEIPHKTTRNSISKMFTTLAHQRLKKIHCKEYLLLTNIKNPANDHVTIILI